MYFALLFAITLASGLILHGIASLLALLLWRSSRRRIDSRPSPDAATLLLGLRFAPLGLSLFFLAAFVVPAFLEYEPRATLEPLSFTLLSLAAVTAVALLGSAWRCASAVAQSRRTMRRWLRGAQPLPDRSMGAGVYVSATASAPIAALGILRTRIFISTSVVESLSSDELRAALAHEAVHACNFDIAKKMLLQLTPAFLPGIDLLEPVTAHWARMCELAADEQSVALDPHHTLDLASALVKVVRLAQPGALPTLSAALAEPDEPLLGRRVRRLLEISENPARLSTHSGFEARKLLPALFCLLLVLAVAYPYALNITHELLEFLVQG